MGLKIVFVRMIFICVWQLWATVVGSFHVGNPSTVLSEYMSCSETDKWQVPDDVSSDEEDASPYLPYHHEPLAFEWSSSSESEDVDGPSLDVE